MNEQDTLKEFKECWDSLEFIAGQFQEVIDKRRNTMEAYHAAMQDWHNTIRSFDYDIQSVIEDARKSLKRLNTASLTKDGARDYTVWRLVGYGWDKMLIMGTFEITKEELHDICLKQNQKARQEQLHTMPYTDYLLSPEWKERRQRILERDEYRCIICNSSDSLNVHHRDYTRRGYELDTDLVTLCQGCHQVFHENSRLVKVEA